MRRVDRLRGLTAAEVERFSLNDLFTYAGNQYPLGLPQAPTTTWGKQTAEPIGVDFTAYVNRAYKANGPIFACILARSMLFSEATFKFRGFNNGRPGDLFGTPDLSLLEHPWRNGTTGDLLTRMEQDASLAGTSYWTTRYTNGGKWLRRLRPDWTKIILGSPSGDPTDLDVQPAGYLYYSRGDFSAQPTVLLAEDVAQFSPIPDPTAEYRGMSWLTPVLEEITADGLATRHKRKFFENAATPNMVVKFDATVSAETAQKFKAMMLEGHRGADNAYETLFVGGGADTTVVGADMKQLDFKSVQGAGETRICAAAGVPPIIVGLSEGLEASTYSNYGQARRKFGDHWARPQWRNAAASLAPLVPVPAGSQLWYDARDISFLQEDRKDAADIAQVQAATVRTYTDAGYTPESAVAAVVNEDITLLKHSGLFSVQLQPAGSNPTPNPGGA